MLALNIFFFSSFASSHRYCNEHLLCPPHVFWTGWGPWERCTAQCGGGIQARRRTCENGPDCPGCSVVSNSQLSLQQISILKALKLQWDDFELIEVPYGYPVYEEKHIGKHIGAFSYS